MANEQNSNKSNEAALVATDNATDGADVLAPAPELGPNGLPVSPPQGEAPETVESTLILDTFFGEGTQEPKSGEGQGKGSNKSDGQSQGSLAPPKAAPAANGEEGSPSPGPSSTPQPSAGQASEGEGAPSQTPGQGSQPSPEAQPSPPQLSVEDRLRLANADALAEQNRQLLARLEALEKGGTPQPQGTPSGAQPTPQSGAEEQPLRLTVPDQLMASIFNDDPAIAKQGLDLLITAVAQNAVNTALARVGPMIDGKLTEVTQAIEGGKQVNAMEDQYFTAFPQHKNDLYRPVIQAATAEKYAQFPHAKWDENMIAAVGQTVNAKLKALGIDPSAAPGAQAQPQAGNDGQSQPEAQGNGGGNTPPKPAPMLDTSNRGGVTADAGDFIASTFG